MPTVPPPDEPSGASQNGDEPTLPTDPFDLDALRVEGMDDIRVKKVRLTVPVRKPIGREFFRVHPGDDYTLTTFVFRREAGGDREDYLVAPSLHADLVDDCLHVRLFTCMSKQGVLFLWAARLPDAEGGGRQWHQSGLEIAEEAKKNWVKMDGRNRSLGAYELSVAEGDLGEPAWPDEPFKSLLKLAFKERYIDTIHHDVLRELRGEL